MSTPDDDQRPRPMHAEPGYARHGAAIDRLMHASLAGLRRGQPATRRRRGSGPALRTATRLRDWLAALRRRRSPAVLPGATRVQAGMAARTDTLAHWSRRAAASNGFGAAEVAANDARYDDAA